MMDTLNGRHYQNLIDYGLRNLTVYCDEINDLNVFPVPDGDTGTNMVRTLQNGFKAIQGAEGNLSDLSEKFAKAVVFGARGNSGVIEAQFFKGFSEGFFGLETADCPQVISALENGVQCAYRAVANPVEGTILTVLREGVEAVRRQAHTLTSVNQILALFLEQGRISLENTPNLLPILKSAGVVDSGGKGILYVFEGMDKYLSGKTVAAPVQEAAPQEYIDYTAFNRQSVFEYGYCTEFLLQQTDRTRRIRNPEGFRQNIQALGDSVVTVFEDDKVKVHVHTKTPEKVLAYAHTYGEFLSLKIENMSVQHSEQKTKGGVEICTGEHRGNFAVVAVAHDRRMKELFLEMGADAVIFGDNNLQPSTKDFLKAFEKTEAKEIFVFPNSKNSNLTAEQARSLFKGGRVTVFETKSVAECYAALSMMDFEAEDRETVTEELKEIIGNVYAVSLSKAAKDSSFDGLVIAKGDFVALHGSSLLSVGKERLDVAKAVLTRVLKEQERDTVTVFAGKNIPREELADLASFRERYFPLTEADVIATENGAFDLLLSFE